MKLYEFTSETGEDDAKVVRVHARIADHPQSDEQSEWIDFQIAIDAPTVLNGALLRSKALKKASEKLAELAAHFEQIGRPN